MVWEVQLILEVGFVSNGCDRMSRLRFESSDFHLFTRYVIIIVFILRNIRKRKAPSGASGVRTEGNITRLRSDDSDDEQNTYNGNSTQQM